MGLNLHFFALQVRNNYVLPGEHRHLPGFQKHDLTGMLHDGRKVAGDEHLAISQADRHTAGIAQPSGDDLIRFIRAHHNNAMGSAQLPQSLLHGLGQITFHFIELFHQVHDGFGIGL